MSSGARPEPPLEILEGMRHPVPMDERPDAEAQRRAAIGVIAGAIRRGKHRGLHRVRLLSLAAAAAALVASFCVVYALRGSPAGHTGSVASAPSPVHAATTVRVIAGTVVTNHGSFSATLRAGAAAPMAEGDDIASAADGEALLALPRGVRVKLSPSTQARLVNAQEVEQRLRLELGRAEVSVPRPGGPRVFAIKTPDSDVIVHGTEFSVLVERNGSAVRTTVSVTRGSVLVVHAGQERLVETGSTWSSGIEPSAEPVSTRAATPETETANGGVATKATPSTRHARSAAPSLADQNRLFQTFLDARDEGDDASAVRALDELLARFPDTPLADQARLARFRALQRLAGNGNTGKRP
jgi:hypothetical protein